MTKNELLLLISKNQLKKLAAELDRMLQEGQRHDLSAQWAQLQGFHAQHQQHLIEGTLSTAELDTEAANLRKRYVLFLDAYFTEKPSRPAVRQSRRWLLLPLVSVAFILIGALKWPTNDFVLECRTHYLNFRINQNWDLDQDVYLNTFTSFNVKSFRIDTAYRQVGQEGDQEEILLTGGKLKWEEMDVPAGSEFTFEVQDGYLTTQIFVDSLRTRLALGHTKVTLPGLAYEMTGGSDTNFVLANILLSEAPQITFAPVSDTLFGFNLVSVSGLDFQRANLEDDRNLKSEIIDGQITSRGITHSLDTKPYISLIEPKSTTLSFHQQGNYFKVRVEGKAKDLTIGARPDTQESVKPTIIAYLAKSAQANLIWNWILGIVGLLGAINALRPKLN